MILLCWASLQAATPGEKSNLPATFKSLDQQGWTKIAREATGVWFGWTSGADLSANSGLTWQPAGLTERQAESWRFPLDLRFGIKDALIYFFYFLGPF